MTVATRQSGQSSGKTGRKKAERGTSAPKWLAPRLLAVLTVTAGVLAFVLANAHLVYVAVTTQPDCVEHLDSPGSAPGAYRAAKSAC